MACSVWPGAAASPGDNRLAMLVGTGLGFFKLSLSATKWTIVDLPLPVLTEAGRDQLLRLYLRNGGLSATQAQAQLQDRSLSALRVDTQGIPGAVAQLGASIMKHLLNGYAIGRYVAWPAFMSAWGFSDLSDHGGFSAYHCCD